MVRTRDLIDLAYRMDPTFSSSLVSVAKDDPAATE